MALEEAWFVLKENITKRLPEWVDDEPGAYPEDYRTSEAGHKFFVGQPRATGEAAARATRSARILGEGIETPEPEEITDDMTDEEKQRAHEINTLRSMGGGGVAPRPEMLEDEVLSGIDRASLEDAVASIGEGAAAKRVLGGFGARNRLDSRADHRTVATGTATGKDLGTRYGEDARSIDQGYLGDFEAEATSDKRIDRLTGQPTVGVRASNLPISEKVEMRNRLIGKPGAETAALKDQEPTYSLSHDNLSTARSAAPSFAHSGPNAPVARIHPGPSSTATGDTYPMRPNDTRGLVRRILGGQRGEDKQDELHNERTKQALANFGQEVPAQARLSTAGQGERDRLTEAYTTQLVGSGYPQQEAQDYSQQYWNQYYGQQ
tara:strand:+ start:314 stop:1447 length:1134 start_codon:yes stop_codon:yes gene_type:complete